tara:strand:+ start:140 stop:592 length:453 start_codon:yes stop_codon:yes gene_type:complete
VIEVEISNHYPKLSKPEKRTELICRCLEKSPFIIPSGTLSIAFLDNHTLSKIHKEFLDDPNPTDVITFPADPNCDSSGEICISVDQAITQAQSFNSSLSDELSLYLIHGWLHLHGLRDGSESEILEMRNAEQCALKAVSALKGLPLYRLM